MDVHTAFTVGQMLHLYRSITLRLVVRVVRIYKIFHIVHRPCNLTGAAEVAAKRHRTASGECQWHDPVSGACHCPVGAILQLQSRPVAASPVRLRRSRRPGYKVIMALPHRPGSAELPEMLAWSSTAASLAVQVSARPRITGSMLHAGRRRPPLACWCTTAEHAAHASPSSPEPARITY